MIRYNYWFTCNCINDSLVGESNSTTTGVDIRDLLVDQAEIRSDKMHRVRMATNGPLSQSPLPCVAAWPESFSSWKERARSGKGGGFSPPRHLNHSCGCIPPEILPVQWL